MKIVKYSILDMPPMDTPDNQRNAGLSDTIFPCQTSLAKTTRSITFSNIRHILIGKVGISMILSAWSIIASTFFCFHIRLIFSDCSGLQMRRSNAFPIVANVHDNFAFWYFTFCQFVRKTVGSRFSKQSISLIVQLALPFPARAALFYFRPKNGFNNCSRRLHSYQLASMANLRFAT